MGPGKRDRTHTEQASRDVWWSLATTVLSGNEIPWSLGLCLPHFLKLRLALWQDPGDPFMRASGGMDG